MKTIGVLWKGKPDSKLLLSGSIDLLGEDIRVGIFKNDRKEKENHPDYRIVRLDDKPQQQQDSGAKDDPGF